MTNPPLVSSIVTSIADFEQLLIVAKRHGVTQLKLGDIELNLPSDVKQTTSDTIRSEQPDINQEAYLTYRNL